MECVGQLFIKKINVEKVTQKLFLTYGKFTLF